LVSFRPVASIHHGVAANVFNATPPGATRPHYERRQSRTRDPIHFIQFSPQQIQVSDLKGLSDLHGLEELFRFVATPTPSVQCCDPRPLCGNSLLPLRNERLRPEDHFF
jgi:hypothetical protein